MEIGKNVFPCHRLVELHGFNLATSYMHFTPYKERESVPLWISK